jgi:hypothetical protein
VTVDAGPGLRRRQQVVNDRAELGRLPARALVDLERMTKRGRSAGDCMESAHSIPGRLGRAASLISRYDPGPMTAIGLPHAGVHVTSLEPSVAFYRAVFGLNRPSG